MSDPHQPGPRDDTSTRARAGATREPISPAPRAGIVVTRALGLSMILLCVIASALTYAGLGRLSTGEQRRVWEAASAEPVPGDFKYLMFPATRDVPLFDRPGGAQVGTLDRALGNVQSELGADHITVGTVDASQTAPPVPPVWVRLTDLAFVPSEGALPGMIDRYQTAASVLGGDPMLSVQFLQTPTDAGLETRLTITGARGSESFTYLLPATNSSGVEPRAIARVVTLTASPLLSALQRGVGSVVIGMTSTAAGLLLLLILAKALGRGVVVSADPMPAGFGPRRARAGDQR